MRTDAYLLVFLLFVGRFLIPSMRDSSAWRLFSLSSWVIPFYLLRSSSFYFGYSVRPCNAYAMIQVSLCDRTGVISQPNPPWLSRPSSSSSLSHFLCQTFFLFFFLNLLHKPYFFFSNHSIHIVHCICLRVARWLIGKVRTIL